ncbi:MAG: hypothetical protein EOP10_01740 [Proteobacteria bacterium]|nr:MAG: hypothetical protein EOP10_01740 [Pseudomonadota bacterium]
MKTHAQVYGLILASAFILASCGGSGGKGSLPTLNDPRADLPKGDSAVPSVVPLPLPANDDAAPIPAPARPDVPTSAPVETIKDSVELIDINSELSPSSKPCGDTNFGRGHLEACLVGSKVISRFDSLTFQFSLTRSAGLVPEEMLRKLLERNFSVSDSNGKSIDGRFVWKDLRTLLFDPLAELKPNSRYKIVIQSKARDEMRPRSNQGRILTPYTAEVETGSGFFMSHLLNGKPLPIDRGLSLDSRETSQLNLESRLDDISLAQRISLRRLGGVERVLCEGSCLEGVMKVDLKGELSPQIGLNSYEYKVVGKKGEEVYRHFSLSWGEINTKPEQTIEGGLFAAIDRENGLKAISKLIGDYAAGRFTMDYRDENGGVHSKLSFNDIIGFRRERAERSVPGPCDGRSGNSFEYLQNLGPYCNLQVEGSTGVLGGVLGQVKYKAVTDIYVTQMEVLQEAGNVAAQLIPEHENVRMQLGVKKFKGTLRIVLKINEAKYFGAIPVPGATGYFFYDTDFVLDGPMRDTIAKSDITVDSGRLRIKIRGSDNFDMTKSIQGDENTATYFNTGRWTENVTVSPVKPIDEGRGLWAKLVNYVVNQAVNEQVDDFKPQIVNGIARDILQIVAPNALNTLVEQLKTGLKIFLPSHLPAPIDRTKINVSGALGKTLNLFVRDDNSYLTTGVQVNLRTQVENPLLKPQTLAGASGFIQTPNGQRAPSPLTAGENFGDGSLLSVSLDVVNQTLYDVWRQGLLGLTIDHDFVNRIEKFAVFDPLNSANGKEILLAEFLPKLMGSDIARMQGVDFSGKKVLMEKDDTISIKIDPRLPPFLKVKRVGRSDGRDDLRFALGLSDIYMTIEGQHGEQRYAIAKLRLSTTADSKLKFVPYQNPMRHPEFSGLGALSVAVEKETEGLDYMVEVLEGPEANSFAIDTSKLRTTINDMVDRLFIPLLNDGLREVPLTGLRSCGVELDAGKIEILPLPRSSQTPFLLLKAPLKNYDFSGHCDLMPDLTSPLPPLPDVVETPEVEPTGPAPDTSSGGNGAAHVELGVNFSLIPWELNGKGKAPEIDEGCKTQIFFDISCAVASVEYVKENGVIKLDERNRPIYDYTHIRLSTLVPKSAYNLRGPSPSVEAQFFAFPKWIEYVQGAEDNIVIKESEAMSDIETQYGVFKRHYVSFETNSPKASGFIPIRDVTLHRVLEKPFEGAEVSTEFFVDTSSNVSVPSGKAPLRGAEGLDYHVGNTHIYDCGKLTWCGDSGQWLVLYDSKLRPTDKSLPEDVVPYLKSGLNAIIAGMFPL